MSQESFYLCVSMTNLPFQIILLWYLSVNGERMCTEYLLTAEEQGGGGVELLCPLLFYRARKASNKTFKVTGNNGHELVWKAVAGYLWMNVYPYLVDFYSD